MATSATVAVGTSSVSLIGANANRVQVYLENTSTNGQVVYLLYGTSGSTSPATLGNGVRLTPSNIWNTTNSGWVTAISVASGATMQVVEL
jgi:hypothetical protein